MLTQTQPVGSGWPQRESNPGPPHQESHALPTELLRPPPPKKKKKKKKEKKNLLGLLNFKLPVYVQMVIATETRKCKRNTVEKKAGS